jgi:hypothetical protein
MSKTMIISRIILISVAFYGIFSICEDFNIVISSQKRFIGAFIAIAVLSLLSLIDWESKNAWRE